MDKELTSKELAELIVTYGSHKKGKTRPISPIEVAKRIQVLLNSGRTKQDIATMLAINTKKSSSKDTSMINIFLKLLSLPEEYHGQITFGREHKKIGIWIAWHISKINDPLARRDLLDQVYIHDLNKKEVINIVQYYNKISTSNLSIKEITENITDRRMKMGKEILIGKLSPEIIKNIIKLKDKQLISTKKFLKNNLRNKINIGEIYEINLRNKYFYIIVDEKFNHHLYEIFNMKEEKIVEYINNAIMEYNNW